ncbi:hypothetical protein [Kitasatospora phosalacinea]|uniref:RNA polymerase sigma-70 region 4 domain-containing protein n=1 Tax=Kitasatospora phosalacinea TaxID=2065 RepID=A0ABW6GG42_9ACTN
MTIESSGRSSADGILADLLPALRWGDPSHLGELLADPRLPSRWWTGTALVDAVATITSDTVARLTAQALRTLWPHLTLQEAMPNLRFCPEGQECDLDATVEQVVAAPAAAEGNERLAGLVHAQLRPFRTGGRDLSAPSAETAPEVPGSDTDLTALAGRLLQALPPHTPPELHEAVRALLTWTLTTPTGPLETAPAETGEVTVPKTERPAAEHELPELPELLEDPLQVLAALVSSWDERERTIAGARLFSLTRIPLDTLGEQFEVTRERIRQVQLVVERALRTWLDGDAAAPLVGHLQAVARLLGPVFSVTRLENAHVQYPAAVPGLDVPLWQVIARILPEHRWQDRWLVPADGLEACQERTRAVLVERLAEAPLPWAEVPGVLAGIGVDEADAEAWLEDLGGFRVVEDHLLPWGRNVNERAEAILALAGEPLSSDELNRRLADGTSPFSLRNQLQSDERFLRTDRDRYGLRRWGGTEYLGIREMIVRELEAAGGEARSEDIVAALCGRFDVSEKSIQVYLSGTAFERHRRGWVRFAATESAQDGYQPQRDISRTRRCFWTGGTWVYRIDITREHTRGSGFPVPAGFAAHLGLSPGGKTELTHQAGSVTVSWANQPLFGSLRPLLLQLEAVEGDHVFLAVRDGLLKALRIARETESALQPAERALHLMGLSGQAPRNLPSVLGQRIGLEGTVTMEQVLAHLRVRGDKDILGLLAPGADSTAETAASAVNGTEADSTTQQGAEARIDPAWAAEIIPLLDPHTESAHLELSRALASSGKAAPVFGYELEEGGWPADFAWIGPDTKIAVLADPHNVPTPEEAERREAAYRDAGWTAYSAGAWLERLEELTAAVPDAAPQA